MANGPSPRVAELTISSQSATRRRRREKPSPAAPQLAHTSGPTKILSLLASAVHHARTRCRSMLQATRSACRRLHRHRTAAAAASASSAVAAVVTRQAAAAARTPCGALAAAAAAPWRHRFAAVMSTISEGGGGGGDGNGAANPPATPAAAAALRADPSKHVAITAGSERGPVFFDAHLVAKHPASPTVVHLDFEIGAPSALQRIRGDPPPVAGAASNSGGGGGGGCGGVPPFGFKPGQWVDLYIPAIDAVGGFSMTSSCFGGAATPSGAHDGAAREAELPAPGLATVTRRRVMSLAVKDSDHPPARFMFAASRVGDTFPVRVGGDVFLDPAAHCGHGGGGGSRPRGLVLVAGGIGITPLHSMLVSAFDAPQHLPSHAGGGAGASPPQVALLHSAKTAAELVFRPQVRQLARRFPGSLHTAYFVTGGGDGAGDDDGANGAPSGGSGGSGAGGDDGDDDCSELRYRRIDHRSLREALAFAAGATAPPSADAAADTAAAAAPTDEAGGGQEGEDGGKDEDGAEEERGRQRARRHDGGLGRRPVGVTAGAEPPLWYLCGPPPFLRGVEAVLRTELGVRPQDVRFERWW